MFIVMILTVVITITIHVQNFHLCMCSQKPGTRSSLSGPKFQNFPGEHSTFAPPFKKSACYSVAIVFIVVKVQYL